MIIIKSRYNSDRRFSILSENEIAYSGDWITMRFGFATNPEDISMIDPDGGPYIAIGTNLNSLSSRLPDFVVGRVERGETGFILHRKRLTDKKYAVT